VRFDLLLVARTNSADHAEANWLADEAEAATAPPFPTSA
jgi:hypothetical protein